MSGYAGVKPARDRLRIETDIGERGCAGTVSVSAVGYEPPSFVTLGVEAGHFHGDAEYRGGGWQRHLVQEDL